MLENTKPAELTVTGRLTVSEGSIEVNGFDGNAETSCRDVAMLACMWGIGVLQKEIVAIAREPGGGISGIGDSPCEWYRESFTLQTVHGCAVSAWASDCDPALSFRLPADDSPNSLRMKYCPKCGRSIELVDFPADDIDAVEELTK